MPRYSLKGFLLVIFLVAIVFGAFRMAIDYMFGMWAIETGTIASEADWPIHLRSLVEEARLQKHDLRIPVLYYERWAFDADYYLQCTANESQFDWLRIRLDLDAAEFDPNNEMIRRFRTQWDSTPFSLPITKSTRYFYQNNLPEEEDHWYFVVYDKDQDQLFIRYYFDW